MLMGIMCIMGVGLALIILAGVIFGCNYDGPMGP